MQKVGTYVAMCVQPITVLLWLRVKSDSHDANLVGCELFEQALTETMSYLFGAVV